MIKDRSLWEKFENQLISKQKIKYLDGLKIFEDMYKFAVDLGVFPSENLLEGIEKDIEIAKILNSCSKK